MRFSFAADTNKKRKLTISGFIANYDGYSNDEEAGHPATEFKCVLF